MTYQEKLKDPRWQKKRLKILERDDWTCQLCKDKTSMLTVHHICYFGYTDPWDYEDHLLITLCEKCHVAEHETYPFETEMSENRKFGITNSEFTYMMLEFFHDLDRGFNDPPEIYIMELPKRIQQSRLKNSKEFHKEFSNDRKEWLNRLSDKEKQEAYELNKKAIQKKYLTHAEYERQIKKITKEFGV